MIFNKKFWLITLFFVTICTRIIWINRIPVHLSNDEISIAYDAYSILNTGRDEHNNYLPLSFQSHSTYKAPLYIYLASFTNLLLGNSELSVRLPSVILGSLTVFTLGYLVYILSSKLELGMISSYVLAVTPWHIYTSRMALESNIGLFFVLSGITIYFVAIKKRKDSYFIFSMILFGLSIWSYHTQWLLTPVIIFLLILLYKKHIFLKKIFWVSVLFFLCLSFPIAKDAWNNRKTTARANTEILINDPGIANVLSDNKKSNIFKTKLISKSFLSNYSNYTNLGHLFFDGSPLLPKEDPYTIGLFWLSFLPFFVFGLFKLKKYFPKHYKFLYLWTLVSPVVPSMTIGGPNMVRNLSSVIPYSIAISCGLFYFIEINKKGILLFFTITSFWSFLYFSIIYYYHFPFQTGENFQYGYKQAALYIRENYKRYEKIVIDPRFGDVNIYVGVPHLYISYFTNLDPIKLLQRQDTKDGLLFDKYQIKSINWGLETIGQNSLYLTPFDNLPEQTSNLKIVSEIKLPNHKTEFKLFESTVND